VWNTKAVLRGERNVKENAIQKYNSSTKALVKKRKEKGHVTDEETARHLSQNSKKETGRCSIGREIEKKQRRGKGRDRFPGERAC